MTKKPKGNLLESLLRYEIILALFTLIGVYYFLTFSPIRMPRQTITSATIELPSPPPAAGKKAAAVNQADENTSAVLLPADHNKALLAAGAKLSAARPHLPATGTTKNPLSSSDKTTISATAAVMKETAAPAENKATPATSAAENPAVFQPLPAKMKKPPPPVAKTVKNPAIQLPREKAAKTKPVTPATATVIKQKPITIKQPAKSTQPEIRQATAIKPGKKSYVIQVGIFIFPDTLKHYRQILQNHGYASFVTTRKRLLPMHRVFLGPYATLAGARKAIKTISKWGDDPFPCRRDQQFYVNVGSFYYQTTAREKINQYRSRGFTPVDFHEPVKVPHHILLVDGFSFDHYPRKALRSIKQLGIPDAFVRNRRP